ncbi:hypothetical protein SAMN04488109_3943 [Chryseolinea serpens]|uniref:DUF5777 domain-containing protein n=1 Tax=Chryseolinea serpens TaxID=947013 RepID=A0A1M5SJK4_9BACT|nr:DUF5777 family beta-barrel protein [Chryseolinea serpens]SHH38093.1 hypothetical protein SAMN04488109_3943 [Chryseolinea serpens]
MKKSHTLALTLFLLPLFASAQDDLLGELEKNTSAPTYIAQTFKGSRLVNGHTVETTGAGTLEFIFAHRFGRLNGGAYELFGLDDAFVRIGLEYGITDNLSVGVGRNSVDKTIDSYLKYRVLRQSKSGVPVTITAFGSAAYQTSPRKEDAPDGFQNSDRLAYTGQLLIARKFTSSFSLQLMPTIVHKNYVADNTGANDQVAIGVGGRIKVSRSVSLNAEYYYRVNPDASTPYKDALGFAIDIETGGHVFQIVLTNTRGMIERAFITETDGDFFDGDIHLGFNVTRAFQLKKRK